MSRSAPGLLGRRRDPRMSTGLGPGSPPSECEGAADEFAPCPEPIIVETSSRLDAYAADEQIWDDAEATAAYYTYGDLAEVDSIGAGASHLMSDIFAESDPGAGVGGYSVGMGSTIV